MELRRNIAELDAEVINLRRHLYISNPHAMDITELIRDTCSQTSRPHYYKPQYRSRVLPRDMP